MRAQVCPLCPLINAAPCVLTALAVIAIEIIPGERAASSSLQNLLTWFKTLPLSAENGLKWWLREGGSGGEQAPTHILILIIHWLETRRPSESFGFSLKP